MRIFGARAALPRGGGGLRLKRITIVVGEPLRFSESDLQPRDKQLYQRLSERVMNEIAALRLP
jgi:1-acyl-sn-glycerol-3-phosphate acyltransferase